MEESTIPTPSGAESAATIESRIENQLFGGGEPTTETPPKATTATEAEEQDTEGADEDQQPDESTGDQEAEGEAEQTLAAHLGLSDDQLVEDDEGNLFVNTKINGEIEKVKFSDLVKGYQTEKAVTQKSQKFAEERRQWEEQAQAAQQQYVGKLQNADSALKIIENQLLGSFDNIDWDKLRQDYPAEWAAKRQEMAQQYRQVQTAQQRIQAQQQQMAYQQQAEHEQQRHVHQQQEAEKMLAANPEWQDPDIKNRELAKIRGFLTTSYGFNESDLQYVTDHRLVNLIKDAFAYRTIKETADPKKSKPVPKYVKPGARKDAAKSTAKKVQQQKRARLKNSGSIEGLLHRPASPKVAAADRGGAARRAGPAPGQG